MYNVLIRPLVKEDAQTSFMWRNDPEIWQFTGSRPQIEITPEIETQWIEKAIQDKTCKRFAIINDHQYIGNVQLTNINDSTAEFHIFIGEKSFWGKGISQLATYQILYYAKEILKISNVYLYVNNQNIAAVKSYEKNGFKTIETTDEKLKMSIELSDLQKTTLSVFVMVYNHAKYLKKCLDSLLMQKTSFSFDIVVGEDCSTDNSREILLDYQKLYPGKFTLVLHNQNIGATKNQKSVFDNCKGKYIAICEGDDYWIDENKLQMQVDFLEANPEFALSYHRVKYLRNNEEILLPHHQTKNDMAFFDLNDISKINFINTLSAVFRNNYVDYDNIALNSKIGDYPLWLLLAEKGKIVYFPEILGVYRDGVGVQSSLPKIKMLETTNDVLLLLIEYFTNNTIIASNLNAQLEANKKRIKMYKTRENYFINFLYILKDSIVYYKRKLFNGK